MKRKAKNDIEILKDNYEFIRDTEKDKQINILEPSIEDYGKILALKYDKKLYKEYVIVDLSKYETGRIGMRWRVEKEVLNGKGETICGNKACNVKGNLTTFEVNFKYNEHNEEKNVLVKVKLCNDCGYKMNHKKKHKVIEDSPKVIESKPKVIETKPKPKQSSAQSSLISNTRQGLFSVFVHRKPLIRIKKTGL